MIPRKKIDIGWRDLAFGLFQCLLRPARGPLAAKVESHWGSDGRALAALSVRTGFDALLKALNLPVGSEILVSAITIRDMVAIIEHHGLRAVSVDVRMHDVSVCVDDCARALTPKTRAVLVAHLFGSRTPLDELAAFARAHGLLLLEDCAQAYAADGYAGHAASDVAMFSFGTIKTATALGGGILRFRDETLAISVRTLLAGYPVQASGLFAKRILKTTLLKCLSQHQVYGAFVKICRLLGRDHDTLITQAVRGFSGGDLLQKLRHQPSAPLLALLLRRIAQRAPLRVEARARAGAQFHAQLPAPNRVAYSAQHHTYWVFPLRSRAPDALVAYLLKHGIDATRGASSMIAVPGTAATQAQELMQDMLYLPDGVLHRADVQLRVVSLIQQFNAMHHEGERTL